MGKSREGSLKKLSGMMAPVDPSEQGTDSPAPTGADSDRDLEGEKKFAQLGKDLEAGTATDDQKGTPINIGSKPKGSGAPAAAGGAPAPTPANTGGMQPGTPDLDSMPEPDEEEEEERRRRLDAMQEVKRWQKIAGIIKG